MPKTVHNEMCLQNVDSCGGLVIYGFVLGVTLSVAVEKAAGFDRGFAIASLCVWESTLTIVEMLRCVDDAVGRGHGVLRCVLGG